MFETSLSLLLHIEPKHLFHADENHIPELTNPVAQYPNVFVPSGIVIGVILGGPFV
jgi:hypothetical protein